MQKKLPYLLPSFVFFLAAPVIWILCFRAVPLGISPQTTHLTEPKTADGLCVDYFRAIKEKFEPKCKSEDNGFRNVVAALGKSPYFDELDWYWESLCLALELDPTLEPTLKFESPREFFKWEYLFWLEKHDAFTDTDGTEQKSEDRTDTEVMSDQLRNHPWTAEEFPYMPRWVEENSPFLDLVAEALKQTHYFVPMLRSPADEGKNWFQRAFDSNTTLPRELEEAFYVRLQYRLGKNDVEGAWQDAASLCRMRIHRKFEIGWMPHYCSAPFDHVLNHVLRNGELTAEQRKTFLADLDPLPDMESVEEALQRWRLLGLWYVAVYSQAFLDSQLQYMNWNIIAAETNRFYDQLEQAWAAIQQTPERRQEIVDDLRGRLSTPPERSWLSQRLDKPVTVTARSRELAWANSQTGLPFMLNLLLETEKQAFEELRERIIDTPK